MHIKYLKGTYSAHFRVQIFTLTLESLCMSSKHFFNYLILGLDATPQVIPCCSPTISSHLSFDWWSLINRSLNGRWVKLLCLCSQLSNILTELYTQDFEKLAHLIIKLSNKSTLVASLPGGTECMISDMSHMSFPVQQERHRESTNGYDLAYCYY